MLKSTVLLSFITLFTYVISLTSQLYIAFFFGASKDFDIYILASSLPTLIGGIISSALSFSLIPYLIKKQIDLGLDYPIFIGFFIKEMLKLAAFLVIVLIIVYILFFDQLFSIPDHAYTRSLMWIYVILSINFVLAVFIGFGNAYHNAKKIYVLPLLLGTFPHIFTILILYFFQSILGIVALAIGQLVSSVVVMIFLFRSVPRKLSLNSRDGFAQDFRAYISKLKYALLAMLCFAFFQTSDSYWAFNLGPSNLSVLAYNQRLLIALGSLVIVGPSILLIPKLTQLNEIPGKVVFYEKTSEVLRVVFSVASFCALFISIFSKQLVEIIFQRGSFKQSDTIAVSNLLPNMLLGMVFMLCVVVLFRIFFIDNKDRHSGIIGVFCAVCYFCLSGLLSTRYGVLGLTYSYFITWIVVFLMSVIVLYWGRLNLFFNSINAMFFMKNAISLFIVYFLISEFHLILERNQIVIDRGHSLVLISIFGVMTFVIYFSLMILVFRDRTIRLVASMIKLSKG